MEAKHPVDALIQAARGAFGTLASALDQQVLSPSADRGEALFSRLQLVPKAEFDRLQMDLDALRQEVARLEERLMTLDQARQAGQ